MRTHDASVTHNGDCIAIRCLVSMAGDTYSLTSQIQLVVGTMWHTARARLLVGADNGTKGKR